MSKLTFEQAVTEANTQQDSTANLLTGSPMPDPSTLMASPRADTPATSSVSQMSASLKSKSWGELWRKSIAALRARWYLRQAQWVGSRTRVWGRPSIQVWGNLTVGKQVQLVSTISQIEIVVAPDVTLDIGDRAFINYGTSISANLHIQIGAHSMLGTYVLLMDNDFHHMDPNRRLERPESAPIILEENVWLASRVIVLRGVTIGKNSIIGAGSVVTKDIPPNVFAAGVPAKVIKSL